MPTTMIGQLTLGETICFRVFVITSTHYVLMIPIDKDHLLQLKPWAKEEELNWDLLGRLVVIDIVVR